VFADVLTDGRTLVAVADGMGGHAAGEVASALALQTLQDALAQGRELGDAFRLANERVHRMATEPGKQGMGTTMTAVLVDGSQFRVANVGDSRVYVVSASGIRQLTDDHSFVAEAMKRGQSKAEAMATPWRDALTRSIGTEEEVDVDVFGPFPLEHDSAFVICSDGLYKTLTDDDLRELFVRSGGPRGAAQAMVSAAFDGGSDDNISVAIAEYGEVPRSAAPTTMVLSYEGDKSDDTPATLIDQPALPSRPAAGPDVASGVVDTAGDEAALIGRGFLTGALVAVGLVVAAVVAILVFGG
jgi:serine/threonine protein phosphatase PrpC